MVREVKRGFRGTWSLQGRSSTLVLPATTLMEFLWSLRKLHDRRRSLFRELTRRNNCDILMAIMINLPGPAVACGHTTGSLTSVRSPPSLI